MCQETDERSDRGQQLMNDQGLCEFWKFSKGKVDKDTCQCVRRKTQEEGLSLSPPFYFYFFNPLYVLACMIKPDPIKLSIPGPNRLQGLIVEPKSCLV